MHIPEESTQRKKSNRLKRECILSEEKHKKCQRYKPMNDLKKVNTIKANVIIVFKDIILCQNANEKTHLSKMIVL